LFIVGDKLRENFKNQTDVLTAWNALTLQRVDRRNSRGTQQRVDQGNRYSSFRFLPDRNNKSKLLLSRNGDYIDVFQLPDALPVARLYEPFFLFSPPLPLHTTTRPHWRNCVLHHTNESIKLTEVDQLNKGPLGYELCPCDFEENRPGPVTVQKLYVMPFANKLNIFSVADQSSMTIQPSFVSESYAISCCCFSPDGSFLATCANGAPLSILIWDRKLCTVIQVLRFPLVRAEGCWWSESLLWIYDGGLVKIPISNGRTLDPSGAQRVKIDWEPTKLLIFSDVLIFIDQDKSVNVARIKNGELQYVEKLPVDNPILCAAVSPCNSIILTASSELTFHVWREDQTSQPLHWVASNTGELSNISRMKGSEENVICGKCCITSDSTKGVLALFREKGITGYPLSYDLILVDLSSKMTTRMIPCHGSMPRLTLELSEFYAGNSNCIIVDRKRSWLGAVKLATGECVAEWVASLELQFSPLIVPHSKNDLVAIIIQHPARVRFLKIVVPE
jgi:WD40 repeat protein